MSHNELSTYAKMIVWKVGHITLSPSLNIITPGKLGDFVKNWK